VPASAALLSQAGRMGHVLAPRQLRLARAGAAQVVLLGFRQLGQLLDQRRHKSAAGSRSSWCVGISSGSRGLVAAPWKLIGEPASPVCGVIWRPSLAASR